MLLALFTSLAVAQDDAARRNNENFPAPLFLLSSAPRKSKEGGPVPSFQKQS